MELFSQIGNHHRSGTLAVGSQFDQEVAGVQLNQMDAQSGARAARVTFNFRRRFQDFLGLAHLAVGFSQASARRRHVIDNETAFVHFGQEVSFQARV